MSPEDELIDRRLLIPPEAVGPNITKLRAWVKERMAQGMADMSGGTWGTDLLTLSHDERARIFMAIVWASERYSYRVPSILIDGGPIRKSYNVATGRKRRYVVWGAVLPYLVNEITAQAVSMRKRLDRWRGITNPYMRTTKP